MKKHILGMTMALVLATAPVNAFAAETETEAGTFSFDQLWDQNFYYSSGAGGWGVDLYIEADGSFTAAYHDSEMGESTEDYPDGTIYTCVFHGQFELGEKIAENAYELIVKDVKADEEPGAETIQDDIRFVTTEPVALADGDSVQLYCPGYAVADLPEEFLFWAHLDAYEPDADTLPCYGIYNFTQDSGFVSSTSEATMDYDDPEAGDETEFDQIANPWTITDKDGFAEKAGIDLNIPEDAANVVYSVMKDPDSGSILGNVNFDIGELEYNVRCQHTDELEDISGLYYDWESEEECTVSGCKGVRKTAEDENCKVEVCQWFDDEAGVSYSVAVFDYKDAGTDAAAMADEVYVPEQ